ncbi:MAG TPA: hypothetical protein VJ179_02620 [Patescibacteria group bacterium]|nr:hypothetical protein [Patescibacteria group bacterium]
MSEEKKMEHAQPVISNEMFRNPVLFEQKKSLGYKHFGGKKPLETFFHRVVIGGREFVVVTAQHVAQSLKKTPLSLLPLFAHKSELPDLSFEVSSMAIGKQVSELLIKEHNQKIEKRFAREKTRRLKKGDLAFS